MKRYIFSDGSVVIDDSYGIKANVHSFWHPEIVCVKVEDYKQL